jgi:hypothetical protein
MRGLFPARPNVQIRLGEISFVEEFADGWRVLIELFRELGDAVGVRIHSRHQARSSRGADRCVQ